MTMSNQTYDVLKHVCLIIIPLGTFVAAICSIWGLPYAEEITATAAALDAFLGACLGVSSANYTPKEFDEEADDDVREDIEVRG